MSIRSLFCALCLLLPSLLLPTLGATDTGKPLRAAGVSPILRHAHPVGNGQSALPAGLTLVDWKQIKAEYERHRHGMFPDGQGGYQSRSHYHGWLARFDGKGFTVKPDSESWSWGLELERWGRQGEEVAVDGVMRIHRDVNRLEYCHQGITEWFVNGKEGLEHGFTIRHRPGGGEGELSLRLRQRGDLVAEQDAGGRAVSYKTAQGGPALHYRKLVVSDAQGRRLPARMVVDGEWLRILVDDRRAVYPILVDPVAQQAYLKASNTGANDQFGYSVAISGDTVVVGAPFEASNATGVTNGTGGSPDNSAPNAGAAYVFVRSSGTWNQQAYLKASNTDMYDYFGNAVAISGDTVVVGAYGEYSNATGVNGTESDNSAPGAGAAYVFVRSSGTWSQQAYLKASNTGAGDRFGHSVTISGDTVAVGALYEASNATGVNGGLCAESDDSAPNAGAAYVFVRSGGTWSQQAYLKASNTDSNDLFGTSVAISEDTVVVGARYEASNATGVNGPQSDNSALEAGAVYVFIRTAGAWGQQAYLKGANTEAGDRFGYSVAISGDTMVVGARYEDSNATGVNGDGSNNTAEGAGAAYVFVRSGGTWSQQAYLKASNTEAGDTFGYSVAISGEMVVVGTYNEDSNATGVNGRQSDNSATAAGAAYVFVRSGAQWSQQAYLKASNTELGDEFGSSVAISGDTVVVGAHLEASNATGVTNGTGGSADNSASSSGAAYVFVDGPAVTSISPASGPLAGGQLVTITGTRFTGATSVTIGGATVFSFTVVNSTTITATTPAGSAGTASVLVTTPGGTNSANTLYTYLVGAVTLGAASGTASAAGETGKTVTVTANANWYTWTATSNAAWLTITTGASTTGSGSVTYNVAAYANSITSRTGTLTIGGQTFTVTQSGVTGAVTLSPTSYTAPVSGAVGRSITVTSNATDFAWTATCNVPWLTITGGASGTGNGTVTYNVATNGGGERTGTLTVWGKTFVVSQGEKPEIVLPQTRIEASFATGEKVTPLMVDVGGTPGLGITVRSLVPWLEVTPNPLTLPGKLTITPSAQLKPGNYLGIIALQAEGVDPVFVYVRLTVTEPPQFIALPAAMQLEGSSTGVLYITSRGRQVRYEAEAVSEGGWLSVTPENGMTPVNLRVTANTYFLKPGVHTGTVRVITREPGGGGPVTIPVTVRVPEKAQ